MTVKPLTFVLKVVGAGLIIWGIIPPINAFEIAFGIIFFSTGLIGAHV